MNHFSILFLLFLSFVTVERPNDLVSQLEELKSHIDEVKGEDSSIIQVLSYDPAAPFRLEITQTETDKKGRITETRAIFNLGLLDKNLVRYENKGDLMWVTARSGGMPVIKVYENGVLEDYETELKIYSKDIDNARSIEEALAAAIPMAQEAWQNSIALPTDLSGLTSWFVAHIKDIDAGETQLKQVVELDPDNHALASLNLEEYGKKGLESSHRYAWNFGDLHEPSLKIDVNKNLVTVEALVRQNQKFIRVEEDGQMEGFAEDIRFYTQDVDQAHLLVQAMQTLIPLAREAAANSMVPPSSLENGIQKIKEEIKSFTSNETKYEQSFSGGQVGTYISRISEEKKTTEEEFSFDFSDLMANAVSIDPSEQMLLVEVPTRADKSYVQYIEDGELQNYTNKVSFITPDLATAKRLQRLLNYVIEASTKVNKDAPKDFNWLQTSMAGFDEKKTELFQELSLRDGEACSLSLKTRHTTSKDVTENLYEFNLYDLDPQYMDLEVKGTTVSVNLPTIYSEEIIKNYEDGGKIDYVNQVTVIVPDIATGKAVLASFKKLAQDCQK